MHIPRHHKTNYVVVPMICIKQKRAMGPSIKDVGIFLAFFDNPLPHVGILTLIKLTSTF